LVEELCVYPSVMRDGAGPNSIESIVLSLPSFNIFNFAILLTNYGDVGNKL
jgi:hypothetical protein